jgi:hypothetical protein
MVGSPGQANNAEGEPYLDPNEIFDELVDLHSLVGLDEGGGFSNGQKDEYTKTEMLSTDVSLLHEPYDFIELNDLEVPLFWQTKRDESWGLDKQA